MDGLDAPANIETFLSIQAQDFIEDCFVEVTRYREEIPEHSSSGLH